ncbi:D-alanyl-D-alanine carboxypeptidase family protein [Halanaerobacter jeridensis]|uniref:serine-type D-Ala-D-Ala carboxypeptidase n=1 Tax=Halanaerobacter jeridensis TaxID=706427 RepID=A0A938XW62_9FIRM|nr:D-alanyl-D-alanine carboxypeptidase family protein [Halanaerobacter jeridensis]MBM7557381.1 D-alanyl-D-alanine carboxypeptidase (penicillin-binding protein 5/6) [Halanaerobacter jeridensis]
MTKLKLSLSLILILIIFCSGLAVANTTINAHSAVLIDAQTGQVLLQKNAKQQSPLASLTKVMTVLVALEEVESAKFSLQDQVTISPAAEAMGGSQIWLAAGEKYTLKELLKAVLLPSANDAAVAVANYIAGTEQQFVRLMNRQAEQLGLEKTHFINCTGLPAKKGGNKSTAHELASLVQNLITNHNQVLNWTNQRVDYIHKQQAIYNTNQLIGHYEGADGLQTGWTKEAGYCLTVTAKRDERRLIAVLLGAETKELRINTAKNLLDYGFDLFRRRKIVAAGKKINTLEVEQGSELKVPVVTETKLKPLVKVGTEEQITKEVELTKRILEAPLADNKKVGSISYYYQEQKLGSVDLVTLREVPEAEWTTLLIRWLSNFGGTIVSAVDYLLA